jgi:predicted component of type VI protein secretion system
MPTERLTERLKKWVKKPDSRGGTHYNDLKKSISVYLNLILNLKVGTTISDIELGFPSVTQIDVHSLESSIKKIIANYEKRLTVKSVKFMEEPNSTELLFSIDSSIEETSGQKKTIHYLCELGIDRKFKVLC